VHCSTFYLTSGHFYASSKSTVCSNFQVVSNVLLQPYNVIFKFVTTILSAVECNCDPTTFINPHKICLSRLLLHRETLVLSYKPLFLCLHKTIENRILDCQMQWIYRTQEKFYLGKPWLAPFWCSWGVPSQSSFSFFFSFAVCKEANSYIPEVWRGLMQVETFGSWLSQDI
jgi:hypothetical protein